MVANDNYTVDNSDQLTGASLTNESYTFDQNGNRTNGGYVTGADNRLLSDGTFNYVYDKNGNLIRQMRISTSYATDWETDYTWDYENRLSGVTIRNNSGVVQKSLAYSYDPFGNRIGTAVTVGGVTTYTYDVYDGGNLYLEVTDPNHLATGGASAVQSHRYFYAGAGIPLASDNCNGQTNWGLTDGNGTVRDVTNSSGVVQDHRTYTSSGVMSQTNAAVDYIFGFDDLVWDGNAKLNFTPARPYSPTMGRWLEPDPSGYSAGDSNLYRAFGNNSTVNVDPSGLWTTGPGAGASE